MAVAPYILFARPSPLLLAVGGTLGVAGVLLRAWAASTLRKNAVLTTGGPYAYTRHPLYLGSFLMGLGVAAAGGRLAFLLLVLCYFAVVYGPTMRAEARRLERRFGEDYREYARRVPLFFPRLDSGRVRQAQPLRARLQRYLSHREYNAVLGLLLVFLTLIAKLVID
ncbi:MAG: isoprenylcysteine carboxylmethyltransferase family protein [Gemmatimonadetes bacterium]|nr:isoprenylcysteine carboxylmethyltransferase family protein [Gemmatimonadota bacterium]